MISKSKVNMRLYRKLQSGSGDAKVNFTVNKELKTSMAEDINKPKGIKDAKVTKAGVEARNPDARLKKLMPEEANKKYGNLNIKLLNIIICIISLIIFLY